MSSLVLLGLLSLTCLFYLLLKEGNYEEDVVRKWCGAFKWLSGVLLKKVRLYYGTCVQTKTKMW